MSWESIDWESLGRLRARYIGGSTAGPDYWSSEGLLRDYDFTFGARIGWKWAAVIDELESRGAVPRFPRILDWGCGTGVAARVWVGRFGAETVREVAFWDRSPKAVSFAVEALRRECPPVSARAYREGDSWDVLLVSHVLNELRGPDLESLMALVKRSKAVVWVEPGTSEVSRHLSALRESLRGTHRILGPCTHARPCGMLQPERARDWCHSFARAPSEVSRDANWARFGKTMGIDLRSLPYSYLAVSDEAPAEAPALSRVIGEPRHYKGYAKVLSCDGQHGVGEFILQKRDAPELLKKLKDLKEPPFFRFGRALGKIISEEKE